MKLIRPVFLASSLLVSIAAVNAAEPGYIAKVNGVAIPASALERAVSEAHANGQPDTPAVRRLIAQQLVAEELFWQEAKKLNLQNSKEAAAAVEQGRRRSAIAQYIQRNVKPPVPDEAELQRRYDRIVATLGPREYRISLIQTADEAALREAAKRIVGDTDFATEAQRVSQAPSAQRGGSLNWISFPDPPVAGRTNGTPLPIAQAVLSLKPGGVSAPIALDDKTWALVRVDEARATRVPDYQATRPTLIRGLQAQTAATEGRDLAARLLKGAKIEWSPALEATVGEPQ